MSAPRLLLFTHDAMLGHVLPEDHPEHERRLQRVLDVLRANPLPETEWVTASPAPISAIEAVHEPAYVERIVSLRGQSAAFDRNTSVGPGTVDAALLAAGSALGAVDAVLDGRVKRAFALCRPPGHHAGPAQPMGFCLFDNVAVAAQRAVERGIERVLIVDWDVHHGNGTQEIFDDRADVLCFSVHRHPFFPGTGSVREVGTDAGEGFSVNVPLQSGADDACVYAVLNDLLVPIALEWEPQLVLVAAGYDSHKDDPLGDMEMTERGFAALTALLCDIASRHADGRIVFTLEGGYEPDALAASVLATCQVLAGHPAERPGPEDSRCETTINAMSVIHEQYWRSLESWS